MKSAVVSACPPQRSGASAVIGSLERRRGLCLWLSDDASREISEGDKAMLRSIFIAFAAVALSSCAQVEHRQQLAESAGKVTTVPVGGAIVTINKEKDLPNIFGRADIYGRKVDAGFIKILYKGRDRDGAILVEQVDVDIQSNASVLTRMPATYSASSQGTVAAGGSGTVTGQASSGAFGIAPHQEQNIVLPPTATRFAVPPGKTLTLPTGQTIEFLNAEPHQLTYRILDRR
jgi:hypothetical protein